MGHGGVGRRVRDEGMGHGDDVVIGHSRQLHRAGGHGLGPLRLPAQHQHRLAQGRGLLLEAAGVGKNQIAPGHEVVHFVGGQGGGEADIVDAVQVPVGTLLDHGAQVNRVDQLHVAVGPGDVGQGRHNVLHGLAVILPAVAGDKENLLAVIG